MVVSVLPFCLVPAQQSGGGTGHMSTEHAAYGFPVGVEKSGAPLRRIVERLDVSGSIFEPDRVRLECGHEARSKAKRRVRCVACKERETRQR